MFSDATYSVEVAVIFNMCFVHRGKLMGVPDEERGRRLRSGQHDRSHENIFRPHSADQRFQFRIGLN
ncbi:hypothetical protein MPLB_1490097 [Mesorhizobium sp. ORS 3324]|nr:hypothetical protein MPLB_1490097 [Mesorhizobium sp. ORS 3324]